MIKTKATINRPNDYFELSKETIYPSCYQCSIVLGIEKYTLQVFDYLIKMSQVSGEGEGLLKVILGTVVLLEFEKTYSIYSVIRLTSKVNRHRSILDLIILNYNIIIEEFLLSIKKLHGFVKTWPFDTSISLLINPNPLIYWGGKFTIQSYMKMWTHSSGMSIYAFTFI